METNILRNIHDILFQGLSEVKRICVNDNIPYFIISGTLLGAVRHKGFIPWDSDIDVGMLRKDYEKFIMSCERNLNSRFTLETPGTVKDSSICFSRVRINGTKLVSKINQGKNQQESLYIDIFPFDYTTEDINTMEILKEKYIKALWRILAFRNGDISTKNFSRRFILEVTKVLTAFISNKVLNNLLYKVMVANNKVPSSYVTNYASSYGSLKERQLISDITELTELEFEGHFFSAPANFNRILSNLYGNYMEEPPENLRKSIDFDSYIVDLGNEFHHLDKLKNEKV